MGRRIGRQSGKDIILHDGFVETRQDAEPVSRAARMLAEEHEVDKDFTLVAMIPSVVLDQAFNEGWFHDEEAWKGWYAANPQFHTTNKYKTI